MIMEDVGKLTRMAIDAGRERDAAIARAERAEAELAAVRSQLDAMTERKEYFRMRLEKVEIDLFDAYERLIALGAQKAGTP